LLITETFHTILRTASKLQKPFENRDLSGICILSSELTEQRSLPAIADVAFRE